MVSSVPAVNGAPRAESILDLMASARMRALLEELSSGDAVTRQELERRLPEVSRSWLVDRLGRLGREEVVAGSQLAGQPYRRVGYSLTPRGLDLLELLEAMRRWEGGVRQNGGTRLPQPAALVADGLNRAILRVLMEEALPCHELERRLGRVAHATVERRLDRLCESGLVVLRTETGSRWARYALTDQARRLAPVGILVSRWRWRWTPSNVTAAMIDVRNTVHLVAPLVRLAAGVEGICVIRSQRPAELGGPVEAHLAAAGRRLASLSLGSTRKPDVRAEALPASWWEALWSGHPADMEVEGDEALLHAVLEGIAATVRFGH